METVAGRVADGVEVEQIAILAIKSKWEQGVFLYRFIDGMRGAVSVKFSLSGRWIDT